MGGMVNDWQDVCAHEMSSREDVRIATPAGRNLPGVGVSHGGDEGWMCGFWDLLISGL